MHEYVILACCITALASMLGYVEFDARDIWVGVFWDKRKSAAPWKPDLELNRLHVWVVLVPCFPIHLVMKT